MQDNEKKPALRFKGFTDPWEQRKLGELVEIGDIDHRMPETVADGIPYLMTGDFVGTNELNFDGTKMISEEDYCQLSQKIKPEKGDILFARYASVGAARYVDFTRKFLISYSCAIIKKSKKINSKYLYHFITSGKVQQQIKLEINTGSQANIGIDSMKNHIVVSMPPLEEQTKIADALSNLDHLITLHQRKLKNLNVLKKCVMQKLFSQKVRFKADDGSEFPKWKEKRLGDVFTERTERSKGGETLLSVTIAQGIVRQSETDKRNTASENKSNYKIVKRNDLAYNTMRMWQGAEGVSEYDGIVSPAYTVITALDGNNSYFFEILFKQTFMLQIFQRYSQGLTSDTWNLKFPAFSEIKCLVPCEDEQNKIVECVKVLDSVIEKQKATLAAWEELKKGLLQQMFV